MKEKSCALTPGLLLGKAPRPLCGDTAGAAGTKSPGKPGLSMNVEMIPGTSFLPPRLLKSRCLTQQAGVFR